MGNLLFKACEAATGHHNKTWKHTGNKCFRVVKVCGQRGGWRQERSCATLPRVKGWLKTARWFFSSTSIIWRTRYKHHMCMKSHPGHGWRVMLGWTWNFLVATRNKKLKVLKNSKPGLLHVLHSVQNKPLTVWLSSSFVWAFEQEPFQTTDIEEVNRQRNNYSVRLLCYENNLKSSHCAERERPSYRK